MENVTFLSSGALNRNHYALVAKQERALSSEEADKAAWDVVEDIKSRITRKSVDTIASSIGDLFAAGARGWGFNIPYSNAVWNSRQAREDLLLLLYCKESQTTKHGKIYSQALFFALPTALTLAEAGSTVEERRTGYLFCSQVLPSNHEMQLLVINTVRKHIDSPSVPDILLALEYVITVPNADAIPAINTRLQELLTHKSPQVRQRVMYAFKALGILDPDLLFRCKDGLQLNLQHPDSTVKGAALSLLLTCFENDVIDSKLTETTILEVIQRFRPSKSNSSSVRLTTRAVEVLGESLAKLDLDLYNVTVALSELVSKAGSRQLWSLVLAVFKVMSQIGQDISIEALATKNSDSQPPVNPLSFLKPLLRQPDINLNLTLLQCLVLLPPVTWTGGSVGTHAEAKANDGLVADPLSQELDANELFGEEAGKGVEEKAPLVVGELNTIAFPPLFNEQEVGRIIGFLRSKDTTMRKLTILVLARADPSEDGIVSQYYKQILEGLSVKHTDRILDPNLQIELVSQALEASEVLCHDDPTVYASLIADILGRADSSFGSTEITSPTLSSKSGASNSTQRTRGRGGVIESAVDAVITK
ncbi:hypothetical protein FRC17_001992, partial [Serendipita sp. 399]